METVPHLRFSAESLCNAGEIVIGLYIALGLLGRGGNDISVTVLVDESGEWLVDSDGAILFEN